MFILLLYEVNLCVRLIALTSSDTLSSLFIIRILRKWIGAAKHVPTGLWPALVAVLCVGMITFSAGITTIGPMDRDEARFAQASKQMVISGDYVTPRFQEELRAKKPAGIYWLQSLSASIFGIDDIASYRIPSVVGGLITITAATILAIFILPAGQAVFAGLFMATALVVVVESHLAKSDAMLTALIAIQQILLWHIRKMAMSNHYVSGKFAIFFWSMMGAAILVKGPIAPVIALGTIGMLIIVHKEWRYDDRGDQRQWHWLMSLRPMLGLIVLTAIVMPWVLLVTSATDGAFLSIAVKGDFISKLQSGQESHGAPPLTYLGLLIITFWPASLVLARASFAIWQQRRDTNIIFLLGWILPFWIMLELTPTKLPHYNMPVFAALAILACYGIIAELPKAGIKLPKPPSPETRLALVKRHLSSLSLPRTVILLWEWVFMAIGPLLGIFLVYIATFGQGSRLAAGVALLLGITVSGAAYLWQRRGKQKYLLATVLAGGLFHVTMLGAILPSLEYIRLAPRIQAELNKIEPAPGLVTAAGYHEPSMVFMLGKDTLLFTPQEAALFLAEAEDGMALVERRSEADFQRTLSALGLAVEAVTTLEGYNISRGQEVIITFYRRKGYAVKGN